MFDEPLLHRAFWQSLLHPYLTVTGGNSRFDLFPLIRLIHKFFPDVLVWPKRKDGRASFRLDQILPANGYSNHHAHDALGDVEGTVFLAKHILMEKPNLWSTLTERTSKPSVTSFLSFGEPVFLVRPAGNKIESFFGQRIDRANNNSSKSIIAKLSFDWIDYQKNGNWFPPSVKKVQAATKQIVMNKAPMVFSLEEARSLFEIQIDEFEMQQSAFLASEEGFCDRVSYAVDTKLDSSPSSNEVEETIYDGFASAYDEKLMSDFHEAKDSERADIAVKFNDSRFRRLANRILFVDHPKSMSLASKSKVELGINRRLSAKPDTDHPWRSIADALLELSKMSDDMCSNNKRSELEKWLKNRARLFNE